MNLPFFCGEVRTNPDGSLDEIVARGVGIHIEQMDRDHWWMSIDGPDGRRLSVNFMRRGKAIHATVEDDGDGASGIALGFDMPNASGEPHGPNT